MRRSKFNSNKDNVLDIENQKDTILKESGYCHHSGTSSFFVGMFWWLVVFVGMILVFTVIRGSEFNLSVVVWIALACAIIMGFLDSETVSRNRVVTVEHRFYKHAICNFSEGRHWTRFFFYKINEEYDSTPFEITVEIEEAASNSDEQASDKKDRTPVPITAKIRFQLQLFDALASEDIRGDGDDDLDTIDTEATDVIESYIREFTLSELERSSRNEVEQWIIENKSQFMQTVHQAGYIFRKIDIINLGPTEKYWKSRLIPAEKAMEAEGKKVDSDARQKRIDEAVKHYKSHGFSDKEAMIMAEARINKQDGYETKVVYEGLERSNAQPMVPLKK